MQIVTTNAKESLEEVDNPLYDYPDMTLMEEVDYKDDAIPDFGLAKHVQ